jgi:hypothetical protein
MEEQAMTPKATTTRIGRFFRKDSLMAEVFLLEISAIQLTAPAD